MGGPVAALVGSFVCETVGAVGGPSDLLWDPLFVEWLELWLDILWVDPLEYWSEPLFVGRRSSCGILCL